MISDIHQIEIRHNKDCKSVTECNLHGSLHFMEKDSIGQEVFV